MPEPGGDVILAIEACGREASVALRTGEGMPCFEPVRKALRHDDDLMPAIERAFNRAGVSPGGLSLVCVSVGPGGFTGLRIAVATAKMLALALGCRIVAVPEALAMLEAAGDEPGRTAVCLAGKRGRYLATFPPGPDRRPDIAELLDAQEIVARAAALGVGRILISQPRQEVADLAARAAAAGMEATEVRPTSLHILAVGERLAAAGRFADARTLLPEYAREPEAVRLWKKRGT